MADEHPGLIKDSFMFRVRNDAWKAKRLGHLARYLSDQLGWADVSLDGYQPKDHKKVYVRDERTATLLRVLISDCLRPTSLATGEMYERVQRSSFSKFLPPEFQSADYVPPWEWG